jgi:DNA-binding transcriptional LysR family regulator
MTLDPRHLRAFLAVAETLHFGRAAEQLGIVQSALSAQIKRLEDVIGGPLFTRGRRKAVELSPAGLVLKEEAEDILARLARTERIGRLAAKGESGKTFIGYVFSAAMSGVLADILRLARMSLPYMTIDASPIETPQQIAAVADASLDIGIIRPRRHYPAGIASHVIHRESLVLGLSSRHPLASSASISPRDLASETFLTPQIGEAMGPAGSVADLAEQGGFAMPDLRETSDFVTAASMAASGGGVVLAPRSLGNLKLPDLVYKPIEGFNRTIELALIWRDPETPLIRALRDRLPGSD